MSLGVLPEKNIIKQNNSSLSLQIVLPLKRIADRLLLNISLRGIHLIRLDFHIMKIETIEL